LVYNAHNLFKRLSNNMTHILGNISIETFLTEYWQKKPLLIKNAMPQITDLLEPDDIKELAKEEDVQARLLMQNPKNPAQWRVKKSPFVTNDLKNLPPLHTLLVQAVDHWSLDVAKLWQLFDFIPQWRRDDVMVSYAPKGGSVGRHFDQYDVFLVQGHGRRRWQLGQWCDSDTTLIPDQPLRLLPEMGEIFFDEILDVGDMLYVPPKLAHYGVAEDDCLTYSFGFRMPNAAQLLERTVDYAIGQPDFQLPLADLRQKANSAGLVSGEELEQLRLQLLEALQTTLSNPECFNDAIMPLLSESRDADNLPEGFGITRSELKSALNSEATIQREPAGRLVYLQNAEGLEFWWNGEVVEVPSAQAAIVQKIADGLILSKQDISAEDYDFLIDWIGEGRVIVNEAE
jgi:50S ribosomal protein L16 3-hydroxylase